MLVCGFFFFAISELFYLKIESNKKIVIPSHVHLIQAKIMMLQKKKTLARLEINFPTHQFTSSQQYIDLVWENSSKSDLLQKVCDPIIDSELSVLGVLYFKNI
jgi:hypothetical protein